MPNRNYTHIHTYLQHVAKSLCLAAFQVEGWDPLLYLQERGAGRKRVSLERIIIPSQVWAVSLDGQIRLEQPRSCSVSWHFATAPEGPLAEHNQSESSASVLLHRLPVPQKQCRSGISSASITHLEMSSVLGEVLDHLWFVLLCWEYLAPIFTS